MTDIVQQIKNSFFLIRTTCSTDYGTGHLRRSMVIAEELIRRGKQVRILTEENELALAIAADRNFVIFIDTDALLPVDYNKHWEEISILIFDLPRFQKGASHHYEDADIMRIAMRYDEAGIPVVSLGHVNHLTRAFRAVIDLYPGKTIHSANYISGPEYVILDPVYQEKTDTCRKKEGILLSMGGTDPFDIGFRVLQALLAADSDEKITVVMGAGYGEERMQAIKNLGKENKRLQFLVAADNMLELIRKARVAIVGFGTTAFECMSQGTPCLTFSHYKWQEPSAIFFDDLKCCKYISCAQDGISTDELNATISAILKDQEFLGEISQVSKTLVDGKGVGRIADILEKFADQKDDMVLDTLFILAHPGDEILGCGGTILKKIRQGHKVGIVFLGEGYTSRFDELDKEFIISNMGKQITSAVQQVMDKLGVNIWYNYQFSDNSFDKHSFLDFVKLVEQLIRRHQPKEIFTHYPSDLNIDHRITFDAVQTACRPLKEHTVKTIFSVEVPSSSDWDLTRPHPAPNWVVDISEVLDLKLGLAACYKTEIREDPHPRSLEGIRQRAMHWGRLFGLNAAEIFFLQRHITHDV